MDGINSYSCTCVQCYTGDHCETDVDDCDGVECQNRGACVDGVNSYACTCIAGFKGQHCEKIDACALNLCQNGATCIATADSYVCECAEGFMGAQCETPAIGCRYAPCYYGECLLNPFECKCSPGFGGATCPLSKSHPLFSKTVSIQSSNQ